MRILNITKSKCTQIVNYDEKGAGGACHHYCVERIIPNLPNGDSLLTEIEFQNGAIKEVGINGCQNEDLIAIIIDRLECFQNGEYACKENELALAKLQEALFWLEKRTADREARGVEGISLK